MLFSRRNIQGGGITESSPGIFTAHDLISVPPTSISRLTVPFPLFISGLTGISQKNASPGFSVFFTSPKSTVSSPIFPVAVIVYSVPPSPTESSPNENERFSASTSALYGLPPPEAASTEYEISSPSDGSAVRAALLQRAPGTAPERATLPLTDAVSAPADSSTLFSTPLSSSPKSAHDEGAKQTATASTTAKKIPHLLSIKTLRYTLRPQF